MKIGNPGEIMGLGISAGAVIRPEAGQVFLLDFIYFPSGNIDVDIFSPCTVMVNSYTVITNLYTVIIFCGEPLYLVDVEFHIRQSTHVATACCTYQIIFTFLITHP